MANQCLAWSISDSKMDRFDNNGPKFYLPIRCSQLRVTEQDVCASHYEKRAKPSLNKNRPACFWGLVTEPIRDRGEGKNYMAFGPYFMEKAKQFSLSNESMVRVKGMHAKAIAGVEAPAPPELPVETGTVKKKAAPRKKKDAPVAVPIAVAAPVAAPVAIAAPVEKKKPRVKRAPKATSAPIAPIAILAEEEIVADIVEVSVKPFTHGSNLYYLDSAKNKLYDRQRDGGTKGIYQGRWDSVKEKVITDIPDSDQE